jgi:hypothetical protein
MPDPHPIELSSAATTSPEAPRFPSASFSFVSTDATLQPQTPYSRPEPASQPHQHLAGLVNTPRATDSVFPRTIDALMLRVENTTRLYKSGALHEEAAALGIKPEWLDRHFKEPPSVAMTEQQMALPTLFGKLAQFGSPAALARALKAMNLIATRLGELHGDEAQVTLGMRTSHDHAVTFKTITSGFFFVAPKNGLGQHESPHQRANLFSNADERKFRGAGYRDLSLGIDKLTAVEKIFVDIECASTSECQKAEKALRRQEQFNSSREGKGEAVTDDMRRRVVESERLMLTHGRRAEAAHQFLSDLRRAKESCGSSEESGRVPYNKFIETFNTLVAKRFVPERSFTTGYGEPVNELATNGIENWRLFLQKFLAADILRTNEPILRLRKIEEDGTPSYRILMLEPGNNSRIMVRDRESGKTDCLDNLISLSQASLANGNGPLLIPIAAVRYAANYGMSGSVGLDDGMPYELVKRVAAAFKDPGFTQYGRDLSIFPYTRLVDFTPADLNDPYHGFSTNYDVLDYYLFANRLGRQELGVAFET